MPRTGFAVVVAVLVSILLVVGPPSSADASSPSRSPSRSPSAQIYTTTLSHQHRNPLNLDEEDRPIANFRDIDVGLGVARGTLAGLGDINNDKHMDLFVLDQSQSILAAWLWNSRDDKFWPLPTAAIHGSAIVNVVPGDFNSDGWLDVLVMSVAPATPEVPDDIQCSLFIGNGTAFDRSPSEIPITRGQPLILDLDGDMRLDLYGVVSSTGHRTLFFNNGSGFFTPVSQTLPHPLTALISPNSNSFIDMNGDCRGDLLVTSSGPCISDSSQDCVYVEIWLNNRDSSFSLTQSVAIPGPLESVGLLSFADVDGDGGIDIVVPMCAGSCSQKQSGILILYNVLAHPFEGSCTAFDFHFENVTSLANTSSSANVVFIPPLDFGAFRFPDLMSGLSPPRFRFGDANLDGYADGSISLVHSSEPISTIGLWMNVPCSVEECSPASVRAGRRTFAIETDVSKFQFAAGSIATVSWFDIFDDGIMDMIASVLINSTMRIISSRNDHSTDSYFLKAMGLSGFCGASCIGVDGKRFHPYGVNLPGATFQFHSSTWAGGGNRAYVESQLPQSSHFPLNNPFVHFGLGSRNNYIDRFTFGLSLKQHVNFQTFLGVIPNTQLVAIPYTPGSPANWILELFVAPSSQTLGVALFVLITIACLSVPIWFLRRRERLEDERERKQMAHAFSFAAM